MYKTVDIYLIFFKLQLTYGDKIQSRQIHLEIHQIIYRFINKEKLFRYFYDTSQHLSG